MLHYKIKDKKDIWLELNELDVSISQNMANLNLNIDDWNKIHCLLKDVGDIVKNKK